MYVLDTNTVIHFFKASGKVVEHLLATPPTEVSVPAVNQSSQTNVAGS